MIFINKISSFCVFLQLIDIINSVELTFELPDNSKECFYQDVEKNKTAILEYQVNFCETFFAMKIADDTFDLFAF